MKKTMSEKNLYDLIEKVNKSAYQRGHILGNWETYSGSNHNGFYYGSSPKTNGYNHCQLCKQIFSVNVYDELDIKLVQCEKNLKGFLKVDDTVDGYGVITWANCYLCDRPLHGRPAMIRGTCSVRGCAHSGKGTNYLSPKSKIEKNNRFYSLSKLPKESKQNRLPILNHVLVYLKDGLMKCSMAELEDDGFHWTTFEFENISGSCCICVPRNTFVDIMQNIDNEEFAITEDLTRMTMYISGKNFKNSLNGIDAQEFPPDKTQ
jgi:hypothetical protein